MMIAAPAPSQDGSGKPVVLALLVTGGPMA
jgi:hypothetical protein